MAATFAVKHSIIWPIVIREGMQWGLTIISGTIPSQVNGRSYCLKHMPQTPFCPCLEANLSPIWGIRTFLILIFTILLPLRFSVTAILSMTPVYYRRERVGRSIYGLFLFSITSSNYVLVCTFHIKGYYPSILAPSEIIPSDSILVLTNRLSLDLFCLISVLSLLSIFRCS